MTVHEEFSRAFTSYAATVSRSARTRPALLTLVARGIGMLLGILAGKRSEILVTGGLAFAVAGAWEWSRIAGLVATGAALIVLDWAMRE